MWYAPVQRLVSFPIIVARSESQRIPLAINVPMLMEKAAVKPPALVLLSPSRIDLSVIPDTSTDIISRRSNWMKLCYLFSHWNKNIKRKKPISNCLIWQLYSPCYL